MRRYSALLFPIILITVGCSAKMVVVPGAIDKSPYAPVNEENRPGIIKYLNAGASAVREARRDDAYRQMYEACGGKYKILREGPRSEGGVIIPSGNGAMYANTQYIYIEFECVNGE